MPIVVTALSITPVKGTRVQYVDRIEKRTDPAGRPYYWLGGRIHDREDAPDSDTRAVADGYISVTPIHLDLTNYKSFDALKALDFAWP